MVTDQQLDHYRTFGFVVLPAYLGQRETAALRQELDHALRDAFGAHFHQRPTLGGIERHDLPMMSGQRTPLSLSLVEDARFLGAARQLLDARCCQPAPRHPAVRPGRLPQRRRHRLAGGEARGRPGAAHRQDRALRLMPGSHTPTSPPACRAGSGATLPWTPTGCGASSAGSPATSPRPGRMMSSPSSGTPGTPASAAPTAANGRSATPRTHAPSRRPNG